MAKGTFVTTIDCMDGRTQLPVNDYMREKYGADFVDTITEAGPDGILANNGEATDSIKERVIISFEKHGSGLIAIVGHHDCAGNPVDAETHLENIRSAVSVVSTWFDGVKVIGLWVNERWEVETI